MKVLLTKKFQKTDIEYIRDKLSDDIELIEPAEFTEEGVVSSITDAHVLLGGMLTESVLKASGHIKLFQIPWTGVDSCLLYTSPSPRDLSTSRMPSSA